MLNTKLTQNLEECIKDYFPELIDRERSPFKVYEARMPVNMVEMWQELSRLGFIEDTPKVRKE